jgi:hypothetical protein
MLCISLGQSRFFLIGMQALTACPFTNDGVAYIKINPRGQINGTHYLCLSGKSGTYKYTVNLSNE